MLRRCASDNPQRAEMAANVRNAGAPSRSRALGANRSDDRSAGPVAMPLLELGRLALRGRLSMIGYHVQFWTRKQASLPPVLSPTRAPSRFDTTAAWRPSARAPTP